MNGGIKSVKVISIGKERLVDQISISNCGKGNPANKSVLPKKLFA
jgi:hypothetical protein